MGGRARSGHPETHNVLALTVCTSPDTNKNTLIYLLSPSCVPSVHAQRGPIRPDVSCATGAQHRRVPARTVSALTKEAPPSRSGRCFARTASWPWERRRSRAVSRDDGYVLSPLSHLSLFSSCTATTCSPSSPTMTLGTTSTSPARARRIAVRYATEDAARHDYNGNKFSYDEGGDKHDVEDSAVHRPLRTHPQTRIFAWSFTLTCSRHRRHSTPLIVLEMPTYSREKAWRPRPRVRASPASPRSSLCTPESRLSKGRLRRHEPRRSVFSRETTPRRPPSSRRAGAVDSTRKLDGPARRSLAHRWILPNM